MKNNKGGREHERIRKVGGNLHVDRNFRNSRFCRGEVVGKVGVSNRGRGEERGFPGGGTFEKARTNTPPENPCSRPKNAPSDS